MLGATGARRAAANVRYGAAAMALLVAACGGGGGGGGTTSTPAPVPSPSPIASPSPSPAPTPSPTPAAVFQTPEYQDSRGARVHNAISAWQQGATGQGVTIAIIDSGIDTTGAEFAGRISAASADVAGSRGVHSDDFHGSSVALVAAGARNNSGVLGIAWNAEIMALRADAPGSCGSADDCSFPTSAIAAGIDRAVNNGAKVINISLGGDDPGSQVRAAIGRAANAGIVVIVAAGNQETVNGTPTDITNPDDFAIGIRQAGNGNVIIAGSVNASDTISSFSHRAGSEAASYLAALGEGICCLYENGGLNTAFSIRGTSFSAPQISGAVALLRQAFPNLSAAQVVDLLLRTARDAGTSGTDTIYGRGVLDIANAFAPQGSTTVAGSTSPLPLGATSVTTSAAMGDAVQGAAFGTVVLDSYQRAYDVNLAPGLRAASLAPKLAPALGARSYAGGAGPVALSYSLDARARPAGRALWNGQLRLGAQDAERARVLAARVAARIAPHTQVAFAFAQGADGLAAQVRGAHGPAFLVAGSPLDDTGFARDDLFSVALRRQLGPWGVTLRAESGKAVSGVVEPAEEAVKGGRQRRDAVTQVGVGVDRAFGAFEMSVAASWMAEDRTLLGARLHDALGSGGADSLFLDVEAGWYPGGPWRLGASWRQGYTHARPLGFVARGSHFASDSWAIDLSRVDTFQEGDSLAMRVSQPLRVRSGGIGLALPVSWDYQVLTADYAINHLSFAPQGREIDAELAWSGWLAGGQASASLFYRKDPGHFASIPDDKGAAFSWRTAF